MKIVSTLIEAHVFRQVKNDIEFLLLKRSKEVKYPELWQMVTGEIDKDEKAYQTALREIVEETGLHPLRLWVVPHINSFYSPEENEICMIPVFAALVNMNDEVKISNEHSQFKWVNKDEAKKLLAWKGQRESVDTIYDYFMNEKKKLNFVEINLDSSKN